MALANQSQLITAGQRSQKVTIAKIATLTAVATGYSSTFAIAGIPAGVLAGANTANGVVPTDQTIGCPVLWDFEAGLVGSLLEVKAKFPAACTVKIVDMLFKAGAYAFNAAQTLSAQPSYLGRIPTNGVAPINHSALWFECVTAFTGIPTITVTYTNQDGVAGRTTGAFSLGVAPGIARLFQLPLQAGDSGVQKVETVTATVATVGTFNILVCRDLWEGRIDNIKTELIHGPDLTAAEVVYQDSALVVFVAPDANPVSIFTLQVKIGEST